MFSDVKCLVFIFFMLLQVEKSFSNNCLLPNFDDLCHSEAVCHTDIRLIIYQQHDMNQHCVPRYRHNYNYNLNVKITLRDFKDTIDITYENHLGQSQININLELEESSYECVRVPTINVEGYNSFIFKSIKMTHHSLVEANLFNKFELSELEVLDLSHNTINALSSGGYVEHPYVNLQSLNLSNNYFVNIPDGEFHIFTKLQVLDLSHNFIDAVNILTFEGLKQLQFLDLSYNRLQELELTLTRFTELTTLYLNNNRIKSLKASNMKNLAKLTKLNLQNNAIVSIESNSFSSMALLNSIDISNNAIEEIPKKIFLNNYNLSIVNISDNKIRKLPKNIFRNKTISSFSITSNFLDGDLTQGVLDGLTLITDLDLSYQQITTIGDYAFLGLIHLNNLMLNNNKIHLIQNKSFKSLNNLLELNLSHNELSTFNICNDCLPNLEILILKNNFLTQITKNELTFVKLRYLNIENNNITAFGQESFGELHGMTDLKTSNNPLSGDLEANTFIGLVLLPSLDISNCNFVTVKNYSFSHLTELKTLNISFNKIETLEYNSFINLENLETLDLSGNRLEYFQVDNNQIINLKNLILSKNNLETITVDYFKSLHSLKNLYLNNNNIANIPDKTFQDQTDLVLFDISFNKNMILNTNTIDIILFNSKILDTLDLSGTRNQIQFSPGTLYHNFINKNSSLTNLTSLALYNVKLLQSVILSHNNVTDIGYNAFQSLVYLEKVDLSFNNIKYIQPGTFKDNVKLNSLIISNNKIATLNFGMFLGLSSLNILDLSFNFINKLTKQQFHELSQLKLLVVDHNEINTFNPDILDQGLRLSIGENPLPCEILVMLDDDKKLSLTAVHFDFKTENVHGITCNRNSERTIYAEPKSIDNSNVVKILTDIKHLLMNGTKMTSQDMNYSNMDKSLNALVNISNQLTEIKNKELDLKSENVKQLSEQKAISENTNNILEKIFMRLTENVTLHTDSIKTTTAEPSYTKSEYDDLKAEIEVLKQKIDNEIYKRNMNISKESILQSKMEFIRDEKPSGSSMTFTNTCVGLTLLIILCCIIYKIYKSNNITLTRRNRTLSSQQIADSMESPNL